MDTTCREIYPHMYELFECACVLVGVWERESPEQTAIFCGLYSSVRYENTYIGPVFFVPDAVTSITNGSICKY